ncbi:hypothetical protein B296_00001045 [Ensete ventricosum]|uniref:Uncharacterized protein n=1 Tax=Ensete ventricosum TaxID=4639 RepID=A0A427B1B5_ENSVE|nr:hypothetical protein B296_00001045 [Ensete ventricosum]
MSSAYSTKLTTGERPEQSQRADAPSDPVVEVVTPYVYDNFSSGDRSRQSGMWSRTLRLKITGRNGLEKLDVRIPVNLYISQKIFKFFKMQTTCCMFLHLEAIFYRYSRADACWVLGRDGRSYTRLLFTGLGGVNIMQMLEDASIEGGPESGKILLDFNDAMGDRIQVFVE